MTRKEYKQWAKDKVTDLALTYATQRELFNQRFDAGDEIGTTYFRERMHATLDEILAFIE